MIGKDRLSVFPRTPPSELDPDRVLDMVNQVAKSARQHGMKITTTNETNPTITVSEGERTTSISLLGLTESLERAGIAETEEAVKQGLDDWLDTRPVSNLAAAEKGIATLGWSHQQSRVNWRVVVPRQSGSTLNWVPFVRTPAAEIQKVREHAMARAQQLTVTALPTGEVTVWVYLVNPSLSTAVLAQPDLLANGHAVEDLFAVFTPGRPVAVAPLVAARRLTEESTEPHKMLALADLSTIGWM